MQVERALLGRKYRDKVHGVEGVATARTEYLTGCTRVALEYAKDGEIKCNWFDEPMIEPVPDAKPVEAPPASEKPGGPGIVAPSRDPSR